MALWPDEARCAVLITVDLDAELAILAADPSTRDRVKTLSVGGYGATRGVQRLLGALDGVPSTWFVPGRNAGLVREAHQAGHEIANHGHAHEDFDPLDLAGQLDAVRRGQDALAAATGTLPRGFRTPAGEWKPGLAAGLPALGVDWSSSWRGDDLPYFHPSGLVEIPLHHELEDHPAFMFNLDPPFPAGQSRIAPYAAVLENWIQEFEAYHRFGLCYVLRLQPEVIGTPGRIGLLRSLLEVMRERPGVWFATGSQVADHWRATRTGNEPGHPADVFAELTS